MKRFFNIIIISIVVYLFLFLFYLLYFLISNAYILEEKNFLFLNGILFISMLYYVYGSGSPQHRNIIEALDNNKLWFLNHMYNLEHSDQRVVEQRLRSKFFHHIRVELVEELVSKYGELCDATKIFLLKKRERLERRIEDIVIYKMLHFYNEISLLYNRIYKYFVLQFKCVAYVCKYNKIYKRFVVHLKRIVYIFLKKR